MRHKQSLRQFGPRGFIILVPLLVLAYTLILNHYNGLHIHDFGIYQEAIFRLSDWRDFNPYLTVRGVPLWGDHVELLLFVPSLLVSLFGKSNELLLIFEWIAVFGGLSILLFRDNSLSDSQKWLILLLAGISRPFLSGLMYPIHPTVWSVPIWFALTRAIIRQEKKTEVALLILLPLARETFVFSILFYSLIQLFLRKSKSMLFIFLYGFALALLFFVWRPQQLNSVGYGKQLLSWIFSDPISYFFAFLKGFSVSNFIKVFLPIVPITFALLKTKQLRIDFQSFTRSNYFAVVILTLPLFGLHLITNKLNIHYTAPFAAVMLAIIATPKLSQFFLADRKKTALLLLCFLIGSSGQLTKMIQLNFLQKSKLMKVDKGKMADVKTLQKLFSTLPRSTNIYATPGIAVSLQQAVHNFSFPMAFGGNTEQTDWIVLERNGHGNTKPLNESQIERLVQNARLCAQKIMMENQYFFVAKGDFKSRCLKW